MDKLFYDQLCAKEARYQKLLDAVRLLKEDALSESQENTNTVSPLTEHLNKSAQSYKESGDFLNLPIDRKVFHALREIKKGNISAILNSWIKLEENLDENFAREKVKQWVNALSKRGEIAVIEKGSGKRSGIYGYIDKETADLL